MSWLEKSAALVVGDVLAGEVGSTGGWGCLGWRSRQHWWLEMSWLEKSAALVVGDGEVGSTGGWGCLGWRSRQHWWLGMSWLEKSAALVVGGVLAGEVGSTGGWGCLGWRSWQHWWLGVSWLEKSAALVVGDVLAGEVGSSAVSPASQVSNLLRTRSSQISLTGCVSGCPIATPSDVAMRNPGSTEVTKGSVD